MNKYEKHTKYGFEITDKVQINGLTHIVAYRPVNKDYVVGLYYSTQYGFWQFGHYDYTTRKDATNALIDYIYNYWKQE